MIETGVEFLTIAVGGAVIALACGAVGVVGGEVFAAARRWFWRTMG